jgi:hypothetical protein
MFQCLGAVLLLPEGKSIFLSLEGMELMIRCMKEQQYAAGKCVSYGNSLYYLHDFFSPHVVSYHEMGCI